MKILREFLLNLSINDILRGEGINFASAQAKRPGLIKAAEKALQLGMSKIDPAVISNDLKVFDHRQGEILLESGTYITGKLIAHFLRGAIRIIAVVCTIGPELEALVSSEIKNNPLVALAIDGLGNAAVESIAQQTCERISQELNPLGLKTSTPLSPGEHDWPVNIGQPEIFSLLDTSQIGVHLTSEAMMIPIKSISYVIGIGSKMKQDNLCRRCSMWGRCRYKHE